MNATEKVNQMTVLDLRILLCEAFGEKQGKRIYSQFGKKLLVEAKKEGELKTALIQAQEQIDEREANWTPGKIYQFIEQPGELVHIQISK